MAAWIPAREPHRLTCNGLSPTADAPGRARSWGHPVGGVTGEEDTALLVPFGDLGGEREAAQPLDACAEMADAGGAGDQPSEVIRAEVGEPGLTGGPLPGDPPAVPPPPLREDAGGVRPGDHVEGVTAGTGRVGEGRTELSPLLVREVVRAVHAEAELLAHRAAGPVSGDHVLGADLAGLCACLRISQDAHERCSLTTGISARRPHIPAPTGRIRARPASGRW